MQKLTIIISFLLILPMYCLSQNFRGKITDTKQQPLYGSNIYIKEINQGLICDDKGEFQTTLNNGKYSIMFRCLGFKPVSRTIEIKNNQVDLQIEMQEESYELKEVTITNAEDPAYAIIRKAIAEAPNYLNAVNKYTADVYIKANMELFTVSKLVDKLSKEEGLKISDFKNNVFLQESFNQLEFTAPDKYTQTVKAFSSTIPDNFDPKESFRIMNASVYAPQINDNISPLNKDAFKYYKYKYEGFNEENGIIINKIRFEAKYKNPQLIDGYLYIADETWHVQYAELSKDIFGVKQNFVISYEEISPKVYLPMSYSLTGKFDILGTSGGMNYFSSLKYTDIEVNKEIIKQLTKKKSAKRNFEIKTDTLYTKVTDSLATKREAAYWNKIRTIALDSIEIRSYEKRDSIQQYVDSVKKGFHSPKFKPMDIVMGGRLGSDTASFDIKYGGLVRVLREYNFVDGAWLGQTVTMNIRFNKKRKLTVSPYAYYTTGRKRILYGSDFEYTYAPLKLGQLNLSAASVSEDFNPDGISRLDNTFSSAFFRKSDNSLYQKDFISARNSIDLANGLQLTTGIEIAKRQGLYNHSEWGIWGNPDKIKPNLYANDRFDAVSYSIKLSYSPYAYYSIQNGKKVYRKITSPTFTLAYSEGFSSWLTNNSRYRKLQGSISQKIKLSYFNDLDYKVEGGSFLGSTRRTHFADYQQFNTSRQYSLTDFPFDTYTLLGNYQASTDRYWINTRINYRSQYLLLKRLSFMQALPMTENLHLKTLYTPDFNLYTELGYSVDLIELLNVGAFSSFRKGNFDAFGLRLSFNLKAILH